MSIGLCLLAGNIIWGTRPGIPDAATQCDKAHQGQQPVPQGRFEQMREEAKEIPVQSRAGVVHFVGELFPYRHIRTVLSKEAIASGKSAFSEDTPEAAGSFPQ